MKVLLLNNSDREGGAARAAWRLHEALRAEGVDSRMWVERATTGDWSVSGPSTALGKGWAAVKPRLAKILRRVQKTGNPIIHSLGAMPSQWSARVMTAEPDLVHLHWVGGEMMSIRDIGRLPGPVVWTLHDMWAFCGAEHVTEHMRWRTGYRADNRPATEGGFDLNRWTWGRKRRHWRRPFHIVTPSRWLADCVAESELMRGWPVRVVPNPIDTDQWRPLPRELSRELLGLPGDRRLVLFGAIDGERDPNKGFDLLRAALGHLQGELDDTELVVFGRRAPREPRDFGIPVRYTGHLFDDLSLQVLYSAADVLVVPSRIEAFGQTASEAHACGTPVVAFNNSGLNSVVQQQKTGYLAQAFDTTDLAAGIRWVLEDNERHARLSTNARQEAEARFAYPVVAQQYLEVYREAISVQGSK